MQASAVVQGVTPWGPIFIRNQLTYRLLIRDSGWVSNQGWGEDEK